jgi:lysophospholipase L1-like esterase
MDHVRGRAEFTLRTATPLRTRRLHHDKLAAVLHRVCLVFASLCLAMLLGEFVVRALPAAWLPELSPVQPAQLDISFSRPSQNPRLFYELTPGKLEVNAAGYRGPEYPKAKPRGVKRIVGIGDSGAFGLGVDEQDTFLRRLERTYCEAGEDVEVINLAVSGYNSEQELEVLRTRAFDFEPDLIVLAYDHNDAAAVLSRSRPPMPENYGRNPLHSELIRYFMRKAYTEPHLRTDGRIDGYITRGVNWDRHMAALDEMGRLCRERGIPAVAVVYDMLVKPGNFTSSRHYLLLHAPQLALWHDAGFEVVECYGLFQSYMLAHGWKNATPLWVSVNPRDGHPNPEAHRLIAQALYDRIESRAMLR